MKICQYFDRLTDERKCESGERTVRLHWLLPGTFGTIFMLSSPTLAARLESWRFDVNQNRLEINTTGDVQPQAQLLFNPTRLVIDLPETTFERSPKEQQLSLGFRSISVQQFNEKSSRIILELSPGYTLDPKQVKFVGITASRWTVQLPKPAPRQVSDSPRNLDNVVIGTTKPDAKIANTTNAGTQIENLLVTGDGFFIRTNGIRPQVEVNRSDDRKSINIDIAGASLSPNLQRERVINRYGVNRIKFTQRETKSPVVRITMQVDKNSSDWRVNLNSPRGLILLPSNVVRLTNSSNLDNTSSTSRLPLSPPNTSTDNKLSTIKSVELADGGTRLLLKGDTVTESLRERTLSASGGWDRASGLFRITINNARLAPSVNGPVLNSNSPIARVRLQSSGSNTVLVFVQPNPGVQIGELNQINNQTIALQLKRSGRIIPPISGLPPLPLPNQVPFPDPNARYPAPSPTPRIRSGRVVVMIDPGHGGKDSGALGIGGLQEKNIILPISQKLARILQQNGVQVILTRDSDYFVSLQGRVDLASRANADVFVSIHANSAGSERPDVSGLETYYYDSGLGLARIVHNSILRSVNVRDRGVRRARFYVLRKSSMPSILVEAGYMTGREDIAKLRNPQYQNQMAEAIARGVLQYLKQR
ncbi:N-acetylmuramoyl-L-alanine amidase [Plectonema radiosum NIES-515]|uniref:N-acetylmuramoyl-L-alanine amidase n=1 Tax=Plectonema radiosum NIES-515 TaxID=2986073 RepID=A0ABT3B464_9CYAN|nr:N-acetylmuramoyl-L-alanine amidase [Plectonema radiosum]MCV3216173.1 N-acetylmuramoyl-L-alanine amidase [Plectonema radiosum NIES-515]